MLNFTVIQAGILSAGIWRVKIMLSWLAMHEFPGSNRLRLGAWCCFIFFSVLIVLIRRIFVRRFDLFCVPSFNHRRILLVDFETVLGYRIGFHAIDAIRVACQHELAAQSRYLTVKSVWSRDKMGLSLCEVAVAMWRHVALNIALFATDLRWLRFFCPQNPFFWSNSIKSCFWRASYRRYLKFSPDLCAHDRDLDLLKVSICVASKCFSLNLGAAKFSKELITL